MALLTDATVSTISELLGYESAVLEVAKTQGIDLAAKLVLAQQEIGIEVQAFLTRHGGTDGMSWGAPDLKNVVVTEPLHKWHIFQTLSLVYRDAYHSQLNDRFLGKWKEYGRLAKWASDALFQTGIGMVADPISQADRPELSSAPGTLPARTYYIRTAWVNASGAEGAPSDLAVLSLGEGSLLAVTAVNPPASARGWNVYAGLSHSELALQNGPAVAVGQAWVEDHAGLKAGRKPGAGQAPGWHQRADRTLQRG